MADSKSAKNLLRRWQMGDQTAAEELHRRYSQRLCALAEKQIGSRLRRRVGADDIVQSVFRTFFRRSAEGEFQVDHSGSLWQLLVRITVNKIQRQAEYHRADKRDVRAEVHTGDDTLHPEAVAHDPTPAEAAMLTEELEAALTGLVPREVEIVLLRLQHKYSTSEIATRVGCSRWTVRRVLDRVGSRLRRSLADDLGE